MNARKAIIGAAIATALGVGTVGAQAATVLNMTIEEIGSTWGGGTSNGTATGGGHFYFTHGSSVPNGDASGGGVDFTSDLGDITNGTGQQSASGGGAGGAGAAFTSGFLFSGAQFEPYTSGTALPATHAGTTLTIDMSGWGGYFQGLGGNDFPNLAPDGGAGSNGEALIVSASALGEGSLGANQFYYTLDWTHLITNDENAFFGGSVADWHLEGIGTVVPIPAAAWLFGSAVLGLAGMSRRRKVG